MTLPTVSVFAGCVSQADDEVTLARDVGRILAQLTCEVRLGGYNGLMEDLAGACRRWRHGGRAAAPGY
jgi:predicted Rossmann-fold nucleotide-binding protein